MTLKDQVKGGFARGKGVVELTLGDVQHVARRHGHLHQHLALGLFALLGRQALALEAGNLHRVLEAPFVDAPRLPPLDMQGPHVVDVVVGDEPLMLVPRAVGVAGGRAARDHGKGARHPGYARAQGLQRIQDHGRAPAKELGDALGVRPHGAVAVRGDARVTEFLGLQIAAVERQFQALSGPQPRHV